MYETTDTSVNSENFSNYEIVQDTSIAKVFNGYLKKFKEVYKQEKRVIVTFEFEKKLRISNPIRIKNISQKTNYDSIVSIDQTTSTKPKFTWKTNSTWQTEIYFQVVSNNEDNLLSGTYTKESNFQYYDTSNVVLNVTTKTPPNLKIGSSYNFTLMDVGKDNWVNAVAKKSFTAK